MIIKAEGIIQNDWHEDQEELKECISQAKQELAAKIGKKMLEIGLINIEEKPTHEGSVSVRASTVALNPEQLNYIRQLLGVLCFTPIPRNVEVIMNEITDK